MAEFDTFSVLVQSARTHVHSPLIELFLQSLQSPRIAPTLPVSDVSLCIHAPAVIDICHRCIASGGMDESVQKEIDYLIPAVENCSCGANHDMLSLVLRQDLVKFGSGATSQSFISSILRRCFQQIESSRPLVEEDHDCMMRITIVAKQLQELLQLFIPLIDSGTDAVIVHHVAASFANRFWYTKMAEEIPAVRVLESPLLTVVSHSFRQCRISHDLPQLAQLASSKTWLVPWALPRFLAEEISLEAKLPAVRRVLSRYLSLCLRQSTERYSEGTLVMAMMMTWAMEFHLGDIAALRWRMSNCVSARREDPLVVSLFLVFLSNVRELRASKELATLIMKEWRGKKLYLKKERLEWVVCWKSGMLLK